MNGHKTETYPLEMDYLPEKFIRKAREELHETKETKEKCLKKLREIQQSDDFLRDIPASDDYLIQYLRGRKYNLHKTIGIIYNSIIFAVIHKTYFDPNPPEIFNIFLSKKIISVLPRRDEDGCLIIHVTLDKWDPSEIPLIELFRYVNRFFVYILSDPMTQINGVKVLFDFKCNPLKYIRFCTPFNLYILYHGTQECIPLRFKGFHILNPSFVFKMAWQFYFPFLPEKLKKRVFVHDNIQKLKNFFPKSLIPEEYGGELGDYDLVPFMSKLKLPETLRYILQWVSDGKAIPSRKEMNQRMNNCIKMC